MNAFQVYNSTDEILANTFLVRNETFKPPNGRSEVRKEWVWFRRHDDSFESELADHLPPVCDPEVVFESVPYDPSVHPPIWRVPPEENAWNPEHVAWQGDNAFASLSDEEFAAFLVENELPEGLLRPVAGPEPPIRTRIAGIPMDSSDFITVATFPGRPPPAREYRASRTAVRVTESFVQILFGIRSVLCTLFDVSGPLCTTPDYLGLSPAENIFTAMDIMSKWALSDFVPNVKYWKDCPLASFLSNPLPAVPASWSAHGLKPAAPLFGGRLAQFWRRVSHPSDRADSSAIFRAAFSIAQSKRGFAPVPDSFRKEAFAKHADLLSTPAPPLSPDTERDLKRFVRVFFRNFSPKGLIEDLVHREASTSASNESTRDRGGARGEIRRQLRKEMGLGDHHGTVPWDTDDVFIRMVPSDNGIIEERGLPPLSSFGMPYRPRPDRSPRGPLRAFLARPPVYDYSELGFDLLGLDVKYFDPNTLLGYQPFAKVVGLSEPLKVRLITKMQTLSSFVSSTLQRALWKYLGRFPCFDLTSRTFDVGVLYGLQSREEKMFGRREDPDIVSGDYSAATDRLNLNATKIVLEEILLHIDEEDKILIPHFRAVLTEQLLFYPYVPGQSPKPTLQQNGQLMGSILSFPILCVLNLFTYVQSLPDDLREKVLSGRLSLRDLAVLINGDDILFKADGPQYDRWLAAAESIGFLLSLGKNFRHSRFFTVNSEPLEQVVSPPPSLRSHTLNWADLDELPESALRPSIEFVQHGYLNVGLLLGIAVEADERGRYASLSLRDWYTQAVMGAMDPPRAHNLFLHYHAREIQRQTRFGKYTLNLFAHPLLGGLGFPVPPGVNPRFSEPQRHLAARLMATAQRGYVGPAEDFPLRPILLLSAERKTGPPSLGTFGARRTIMTDLAPAIGPLEEGQWLLDLDYQIRASPLSQPMEDEEAYITPSCRLSNSDLKHLLKGANHGRATMLPLEAMTSFPFRFVLHDPEWLERWLTLSGPGWEQRLPPAYTQGPPSYPGDPMTGSAPSPPVPTEEAPVVIGPPPLDPPPPIERILDTSWEDQEIPGVRVATPPPPVPRPRSGRDRRRQAWELNRSQGLVPDYTPREREAGWSRKARRG
jgi:hypothetical protein